MTDDATFVLKHQKNGALLDANVLLVYLAGVYDMRRMRESDHTGQYADAFPLIAHLVETFSVIYTTPNVLTEVSNLGKQIGPGFLKVLQAFVPTFDEKYCVSKTASVNSYFNRIGLTDSALLELANSGVLVITAEWALHGILRDKGIDAVNINHLLLCRWRDWI